MTVSTKHLRGGVPPEDRALRDMTLSAGVIVKNVSAKWVRVFDKMGACSKQLGACP